MAAVTSACSIDWTTRRKEDLYARMALLVVVAYHRWSHHFSVPGLAACDFVCVWRTHRWITSTQRIFWMMRTLWERAFSPLFELLYTVCTHMVHITSETLGRNVRAQVCWLIHTFTQREPQRVQAGIWVQTCFNLDFEFNIGCKAVILRLHSVVVYMYSQFTSYL